MNSFARTATVDSEISHEQLFEVLKAQVRNPTGIIPELTKSEVVEELDSTEGNVIVRKYDFSDGHSIKDKATIIPPSLILVEFLDMPGGIGITISDDNEGKLYLTHTIRISDKTDEGRARIALAKGGSPKALLSTIEKAKKFVKEGRI